MRERACNLVAGKGGADDNNVPSRSVLWARGELEAQVVETAGECAARDVVEEVDGVEDDLAPEDEGLHVRMVYRWCRDEVVPFVVFHSLYRQQITNQILQHPRILPANTNEVAKTKHRIVKKREIGKKEKKKDKIPPNKANTGKIRLSDDLIKKKESAPFHLVFPTSSQLGDPGGGDQSEPLKQNGMAYIRPSLPPRLSVLKSCRVGTLVSSLPSPTGRRRREPLKYVRMLSWLVVAGADVAGLSEWVYTVDELEGAWVNMCLFGECRRCNTTDVNVSYLLIIYGVKYVVVRRSINW